MVRNGDVLVMRANPRLARRWYLGFVLPGVPLVVLFLVIVGVPYGWRALLIILGVAVVVFPLVYLCLQVRVRLAVTRLTPMTVSARTWYGRLRTVPRQSIARVVLLSVDLSTVSARPPIDYMLFVDPRGRCRLRVWTGGTAPHERAAFAAALGVTVETRDEPLKPKRMRDEFPGSISWHLAHQWLFAFLIFAGGFLAAVCALVILGATGHL
jgi:hypothetical protein